MTDWISISCRCHNGIINYYGVPEKCSNCDGSGTVWVTDGDMLASYPGGPFLRSEPGLFAKARKRGAKIEYSDGVWWWSDDR